MKVIVLNVFFGLFLFSTGYGQTCCSGGVPVSNTMGLPVGTENTLLSNISFDYHNLNSLYNTDKRVEDNTRQRLTQSTLLQVGYNSKGFSIETLLPFIQQKRVIRSAVGTDTENSVGLGDAAFLLGRSFGKSQNLNVSLGVKAPTGRINSLANSGVRLNADMQSGTGSWDGIFLLRYAKAFQNNTYYLQGFHLQRGEKEEFESGLDYQFGHETQVTAGWVRQEVLGNKLVDFGLAARYRKVGANYANGELVPSSGGDWLLGNLLGKVYFREGKTALTLTADIPIWLKVVGLQNVPTYRLNVALFNAISFKSKN